MSGTTSNGLPYPTGNDKVVDGDNAIRALAEAIGTAAITTRYTASAPFARHLDATRLPTSLIVVYCQISAPNLTDTGWTSTGIVLASKYWPSDLVMSPTARSGITGTDLWYRVRISAAGEVEAQCSSPTTSYLWANLIYIAHDAVSELAEADA